ncbi:hypothetical protein AB0J86_20550 [Micromonospora sp. NPDC049559]|uniref:hypothetical protein n=1 Tax=Micromonospora sp. NPDC049559 TaxID=3155923 RepID=UPI0034430181
METHLRLTLTELLDPAGTAAPAGPLTRSTRTVWCRVPACWVVDGRLPPGHRARLVDGLRAPRRPGDRLQLLVSDVRARVLSEPEASRRPWLGDAAGCYVWLPDGRLRAVLPAEL